MAKSKKFGSFEVQKDESGWVVRSGEWMDGPFASQAEATEVAKEMAGLTGGDKKQTPAKAAKEAKKATKERAPKKEEKAEAPKVKKPSRAKTFTPQDASPEEFFTINKRNKPAFVPGWDAKLTGILKRVASGVCTEHDRMIANSPVILNHPKVVDSHHFQVLLGNEVEEEEEAA